MRRMISRIYSHYASADQAIRNLKAAGLSGDAISILSGDTEGWHEPGGRNVDPRHDKNRDGKDDRAQGAVTGGGIGLLLGAATGFVIGMRLIEIPNLERVIAAGWYAPVLIGAVALAILGALIGMLAESGTSRENAALYDEALRRGGALVTARVHDADIEKYAIIMDSSAVEVERREDYREPALLHEPAPPSAVAVEYPPRPRDGSDVDRTG